MSRSSVQAPVDRYFQPPSAETTTTVPRSMPARGLGRAGQGGPGRDAGEDPDVDQAPGPFDGLAGSDDLLAVEELGPPVVDEDGRDVAVVQVAEAVHHLPGRRLDGQHLDVGVALLQEAADAEQGARGAQAGHEVGDLGTVAPDLRAGPLVVGLRVGRVGVLVEEGPLGMLLGELPGPAHRAVGTLLAGRVDDLGAPDLEQLPPLGRHVGGQHHLQVVALHLADQGHPDAGVARGRLDERLCPAR